ncbi:MAG TPA: SDR family oxidoreductase [Phycisphaerales bacterium]|nr:SDR family oxidoreductase [Phycisphaerales bacterium]
MGSGDLFDLQGSTALVTGASRGIGGAIAMGLAQQGADVVLLARGTGPLEQARRQIETQTGRRVWVRAFDMGAVDAVESMFAGVVDEVGSVDILVNAAGTTVRGPSEDLPPDGWARVLDVNLTAVLRLCQAFCRHRKSAGGGRIINIGSLMCDGARAGTAAYAASKGGLLMLTKTLAVEWARYGITANLIGPGYIRTELTKPLWTDNQFNQWVLSKTPANRWGEPEDLVGTAVLLASKAGAFITGQIIYVDGGWLAML